MAVEATHLNLFPSQLHQERDMVNPCNNQISAFNAQQMCFPAMVPFGATLPVNYSLNQPTICDSLQAKTSVNTDSGLTYNIAVDSRKRSRDSMNQLYAGHNFHAPVKNNGEDMFSQHQLEIDALITQHNKKIRYELEERQKQQTRLLTAAIGEGVMKKLKEKDDQIQRMSKLNFVLQERVKSLFVENQLWRDLAQSNEATANSLRSNLEQVLAHVSGEERISGGAAAVVMEEDVESCCGSNDIGGDEAQDKEVDSYREQKCRRCGERESCVLLLPCRHLCLCNVCGSGSHQIQACPVCNSVMNATLHVNLTS